MHACMHVCFQSKIALSDFLYFGFFFYLFVKKLGDLKVSLL